MSDPGLSEWWSLASGKPYHGWRRLVHSGAVPLVLTIALANLAERIFG